MQDNQLLLNDFPFNRIIEVTVIENAGGLTVMWDDSLLKLDEIATTDQKIHAIVKVRQKNDMWLFSCIYANTFICKRKILWQNLQNIKDNFPGKWLIGGDLMNSCQTQKRKEVS